MSLALAVLAGPAYAQTAFNKADANRDGRLEETEFYKSMGDKKSYGKWDTNDDGFIEEREFNEIGFDRGFGGFGLWDKDANRFLDATETYDGIYDGYDRDESGHWDATEWDDAGNAGLFDL